MQQWNIKKTFESIVEFAGIEKFIDMYPYQLSTGMSQRLAFSIAVHTKPEILLLDEVFSAGDMAFQVRAQERMTELIQSDVTVVIVSHNMDRIEELCDRVLWLENGSILLNETSKIVIEKYRQACQSTQ